MNCGRTPGRSFYEHGRLGTNYRLGAFQAAVLLAQFERLPEQIAHRTRNAALLKSALSDVDEIVWQMQPDGVTQNSWYLMVGRLEGARVEPRIETPSFKLEVMLVFPARPSIRIPCIRIRCTD